VEEDAADDLAAVERDQVETLAVEGKQDRLTLEPQRLAQYLPAQIELLRILGRVDPDEGQLLTAQMSSSSPSTSRARSMMNLKRAETSLPSRSLITRSVSSSSTMLTRSD